MRQRILWWAVALLTSMAALASPSVAADFPDRPVKILVGFAPGGTTDLLARIVADKLHEYWGSPVVVENRPGADGVIATSAMLAAPPNGHTLLMSTNALVITPHLQKLPYDPIKDFEPITIVGQEFHHLLINPSVPARSVRELIALAKSEPGKLNFSSAGPGSAPFLAMEKFKQAAGIDLLHIAYSGSMPAVVALSANNVQAMFSSPSTTMPLARAGKILILAVAGPTRDMKVPEVPTMAEAGLPGFISNTWFALMAPAKIPAAVLEKVRTDSIRAVHEPDVQKRLLATGTNIVGNSSEDFREIIAKDFASYGDLIRSIKAKSL